MTSAEHVSACGRRNGALRRTGEKTSGTQGSGVAVRAGIPSTLPLLLFILFFSRRLPSRRTPLPERAEQATLPLEKLRVDENNNIYLT